MEGCPPAVVTGIEICIIAFKALQLLLVTKVYNLKHRKGGHEMAIVIIPEQRRDGKRTCLRLSISSPELRFIALATLKHN
jgi:hypothetical protein